MAPLPRCLYIDSDCVFVVPVAKEQKLPHEIFFTRPRYRRIGMSAPTHAGVCCLLIPCRYLFFCRLLVASQAAEGHECMWHILWWDWKMMWHAVMQLHVNLTFTVFSKACFHHFPFVKEAQHVWTVPISNTNMMIHFAMFAFVELLMAVSRTWLSHRI